jgi:hypothetical protein
MARPKLVVAALRSAQARRVVAKQRDLIARLKAAGHLTSDAEQMLQTYLSMLKHLEAHHQKLGDERRAKKTETKKS